MKNLKVSGSLLLIFLSGMVQAQQKYELTVKEAVELAYKNVVELKNAQVDYKIQEAKNKEILGQALPQVNGNFQANHYLQLPTILFPQSDDAIYEVLKREGLLGPGASAPPPSLVAFSFQQPWNMGLGVTLTQLLFQPDVFVGLQARKAALNYSQSLIEQTKEKIKDSAYKRYYAILIAQKQLYFLDESIKRLEKLYHDDSVMFKNGFAEKLDLDKVQVQLNNLRSNRSVVENAINLAYAALKFSIGIPQKDTVLLKEELTVDLIKEGILDDGFKYEDRPEIRTLNVVKELQQLDIKRYKMSSYPTIALSANYSANAMGKKFYTDPSTFWYRSSFIGLNMNVPIFQGFQRKYKVVQAQLALEKLNNNVENVKQAIDLEQVATRESLKNAILNLDMQDRNMALAERVYQSTKIKFEQGLGSSFEVLQADADFQMAQSSYFNALYNATVARVSYLYSLGKLQ